MGYEAIQALLEGESNVMIALNRSSMERVAIDKVLTEKKDLDLDLIKLTNTLS
jgi:6-phosphofructokinase 1